MPKFLGKLSETDKAGICLLAYGPTSAGKTASFITGIPKILCINKESKDPRLVHSTLKSDYSDIVDYVEFDDFWDEMEYLNNLILKYEKGERPYQTIAHDGLTFSMHSYKRTVEDARFIANNLLKKEAEKVGLQNILDLGKKEWADWNTLAGLMARETVLLNKLSKFGILVVSTAISMEYPRYTKAVSIAPALLGKEFPQLIHGLFDSIGYVCQPFHINEKREIIVPKISFVNTSNESDFGQANTYLCRANGLLMEAEIKYGPLKLDLTLLAKIIRGEFKV
ncbi:MAG: hypothetical protein IMZ43_09635 [Thermoplasmata archaeon]|nr:hypothetical protein [Thermoplasmata archaeon]